MTNLHHFLTTCIWDALNGNANQMRPSLDSTQKCWNNVFLLKQKKFPGCQKPHAQTVAWTYDMAFHAQKCAERYCELANKKVERLYKVSGRPLIQEEELDSSGECSQTVKKCLYLARIGRSDLLWSVNKLARSVTKWTQACDKRLARLISYIFIRQMTIVNIVMWETRHSTADFSYFKTQTLQATLRIQSQPQEVSLYFWKQNICSSQLDVQETNISFS